MHKNIKSLIVCFFLFFLQHTVFATPTGLWQNKDCILFFDDTSLDIVLKLFYGWYFDSNKLSPRNAATHPSTQDIKFSFNTTLQEADSWAGELVLTYPNQKEQIVIPLAQIDNEIYLDFALVVHTQEGDSYLKRMGNAHYIARSPLYTDSELESLYITKDNIYRIRYWLSNMQYEDTQVSFEDGASSFYVNKQIKTAGLIYTCTNSRETKIRNITKSPTSNLTIKYNKSGNLAFFMSPYLTKIADTNDNKEQLNSIIKEVNSKQHIIPPLVFPLENKPLEIEPFNETDERIKFRQSP